MTEKQMTIAEAIDKANDVVNEFGGRVWAGKEPKPGRDDIHKVAFYAAKAKLRRAFRGATIILSQQRLIIIEKDGTRISI